MSTDEPLNRMPVFCPWAEKAKWLHYYTVEGHGHFPSDMLRYDRSLPAAPEDVDWMMRTDKRSLLLVSPQVRKSWVPTVERWRSFGWEVDKFVAPTPRNETSAELMARLVRHYKRLHLHWWDVSVLKDWGKEPEA